MEQITVRRMEQILVHPLDLCRKDVTHAIVELLHVVPLAAELEGGDEPVLRQNFQVIGRHFGDASTGRLDGQHVGQAVHPDICLVSTSLDVAALVNPEEFRMQRAMVEGELQVRHPLEGFTKFHRFLRRH